MNSYFFFGCLYFGYFHLLNFVEGVKGDFKCVCIKVCMVSIVELAFTRNKIQRF